jgi:hypothetical protein
LITRHEFKGHVEPSHRLNVEPPVEKRSRHLPSRAPFRKLICEDEMPVNFGAETKSTVLNDTIIHRHGKPHTRVMAVDLPMIAQHVMARAGRDVDDDERRSPRNVPERSP